MSRTVTDVKWETVTNEPLEVTDRLAVPGGWIYRTSFYLQTDSEATVCAAMVFVPDQVTQRGSK